MVGYAKAAEIAFTGATLSAAEALDYGLVNRVVADDVLAKEARELALSIAAASGPMDKGTFMFPPYGSPNTR